MATPNLYVGAAADPFAGVPPQLQTNSVDVLYVTDRCRDDRNKPGPHYGRGRSPSLAFGTCQVTIGRNLAWDQLVQASRSRHRKPDLSLDLASVHEIGTLTGSAFCDALSQRLAVTARKEIYLYIHGFNTEFRDAAYVLAQLWHFLGRGGVPVLYTWPSWPLDRGGLRSYTFDRESAEFTVRHLKQLLTLFASCPGVVRIHLIAHSMGAVVALTALRELHLSLGGDPTRTREALRLGTLILAAPDLDLEIMEERVISEGLHEVPQRTVVYASDDDWSLALADWAHAGSTRVGRLRPNEVAGNTARTLQGSSQLQIIDAKVSGYSRNQHDYFYRHPAVSSDLILVLRGHLDPGSDRARPLAPLPHGLWQIGDDYPRPPAARSPFKKHRPPTS